MISRQTVTVMRYNQAGEVPVFVQLMQRPVKPQKNLLRGVLGVLDISV
jgi:hypothetical protein